MPEVGKSEARYGPRVRAGRYEEREREPDRWIPGRVEDACPRGKKGKKGRTVRAVVCVRKRRWFIKSRPVEESSITTLQTSSARVTQPFIGYPILFTTRRKIRLFHRQLILFDVCGFRIPIFRFDE